MGLWERIKEAYRVLTQREVKEAFNAEVITSRAMERAIERWYSITNGNAPWLYENGQAKDDVETINFAAFINNVTASLVTLNMDISISGGARAKWMQEQANYVLKTLNDRISIAVGNCGIMFKPNGKNVDYMEPGTFYPTDINSNGDILGCIFKSETSHEDYFYTRLEWQRFVSGKDENGNDIKLYKISNVAFRSKNPNNIGKQCNLSSVPEWAKIQPEVNIAGIEKPIFAFFKVPFPNYIDRNSPLGAPIWAQAEKELRDLDIAWSMKSNEIEDSTHMTFVGQSLQQYADNRHIRLPRMVKAFLGGHGFDGEKIVHEHVATLLTEQRINDINSILAMISAKCGFSQSFFRLDEKTGLMTATQVEAEDQETVRTIKSIRDALRETMLDLFDALDVMATLYKIVPKGSWEADFNFGDILYNFEEDRQHHYALALQGRFPWVEYYVKYLGYGEDEAKELLEKAKAETMVNMPYADEE